MYRLSPAGRGAGRVAAAHAGSDTAAMRTVTHSVVQRQHVDASGRSHHTALAGEDAGLGRWGPGTVPPRPAGAGTGLGRRGGLCSPPHPVCVWHWEAPGRHSLAPTRGAEGVQSPRCRAMAWMMQKIPSGPVSRSGAGRHPSSLIFWFSKTSFSRSGQRVADPTPPPTHSCRAGTGI